MIYLATPYTHEDPSIVEERYLLALDITQFFLKQGVWIFSPIVHCHEIAKRYNLPGDFSFWHDYDEEMISIAKQVWFALIPGYSKSKGMKLEYTLALNAKKIINVITPLHANWGGGNYKTYAVSGNFLDD
jgi:hypothetical protein